LSAAFQPKQPRARRNGPATLATVLLLALWLSCGGSSSSTSSSGPPSKVAKRVFVTNQSQTVGIANGILEIINALNDKIAGAINLTNRPSIIAVTPDKKTSMIFDQQDQTVQVIDNTKETLAGTIAVGEQTTSMVTLSDNKSGYVALRNLGQVSILDLVNFKVTVNIPIPTVRTLVQSHNGSKVLAFSDDSDTMNIIDTATNLASPVAGFDRPVFGVFSTDDSKAFILSCGAECSGNTARVTVLDIASKTPGQSVNVSAATIGLLDGSNLYVAGTRQGSGRLDVVNTTTMAVTKSAVPISDGFHNLIALAGGKLFIGARTCNNITNGCLSIFDTTAQTAVVDAPKGDVTGMQPIDGRNVVYVCEGGELRIYSTQTGTEQTNPSIDIVGRAIDVKAID
jgi:DNA-binding beta-propeller fold protein YncE